MSTATEVREGRHLIRKGTMLQLGKNWVRLESDVDVTVTHSLHSALKPLFKIGEAFLNWVGDGDSPQILKAGMEMVVGDNHPNEVWRGMRVRLWRQSWDLWLCHQVTEDGDGTAELEKD